MSHQRFNSSPSFFVTFILICAIFLALPIGTAQAGDGTWTQFAPEGGDFIDIAVNPYDDAHILAVVADSLFQSIDGGRVWSELPRPESCEIPSDVEDIRIKIGGTESNLSLLFSYCDKLFLSPYPEINWRQLDHTPYYPGSFEISRTEPLQIAVISLGRLMVSSDGANTWRQAFANVSHLAMDVSQPNTILVNSEGELYASRDFGVRWSYLRGNLANYLPDHNPLGISPANAAIYAGSYNQIYISTDFGQTWITKTHPTNDAYDFVFSPDASVFVVNGYITSDGGDTWTRLPARTQSDSEINEYIFASVQPLELLVGTKEVFSRLNADGSPIFESAQGINRLSVKRVVINSDNASEMYFQSDHWYYTSDAGNSWRKFSAERVLGIGDKHNFCKIYTVNGEYSKQLYRSYDCGQSFEAVNADGRFTYSAETLLIDPHRDQVVYVESFQTLYISYDGGFNWIEQFNPLYNRMPIILDPREPGYLYHLDNVLWRSHDSGVSWRSFMPPRNNLYAEPKLAAADLYGSTHLLTWLDGEAWVSLDKGENWVMEGSWTNSAAPGGTYVGLLAYFAAGLGEDVVLAVSGDTRMFSYNYGTEWIDLPAIPLVPNDSTLLTLRTSVGALGDGIRVCEGTRSRGLYCLDIQGIPPSKLFLPAIFTD